MIFLSHLTLQPLNSREGVAVAVADETVVLRPVGVSDRCLSDTACCLLSHC